MATGTGTLVVFTTATASATVTKSGTGTIAPTATLVVTAEVYENEPGVIHGIVSLTVRSTVAKTVQATLLQASIVSASAVETPETPPVETTELYDEPDDFYDNPVENYNARPFVPPDGPPDEPPGPVDPPEDPGPGQARFLQRTLPEAPPLGVYRLLVGDLMAGGISEELPFDQFTYSFLRNRPGGFSGSITKTNPKAIRDNLRAGETALYVERDGVLLWGGIVLQTDSAGDSVNVGAEGFWGHFRKTRHPGIPDPGAPGRFKLKRYNDVDQLDIVRDLIRFVQEDLVDLDIGVVVDTNTSVTVRDEVFRTHEKRNIGEAIEKMAEDNNGFDFSLDVEYQGDAIVKRLKMFTSRGRRTDIVFDDGKNCRLRTRSIDAKDMVREVMATGSGSGAALRRFTVRDETLAGQRPGYQDVVSFTDVNTGSETKDIQILTSRATKQIARRKDPMQTVAIDIFPQADLPLGSWRVGDYVRVRAEDTFDPLDDFMRIVTWQVDVDEAGQEQPSMDFGPIPA